MNKKLLWSLLGITSVISICFAYLYFDKAMPLVHISITMDRNQAQQQAVAVAKEFDLDVDGYDCAIQFKEDNKLQAFVELEGGGKQAFIDMIDQGYYQPYLWKVRFFKEKEVCETAIYFRPDGTKNGFEQKLSEDQPGHNLSEEKAKHLAESMAETWNYDLNNYDLVEHNQQEQPSKRVDHVFVYERSDVSLNKGLYRLKITISGDRVTSIWPYIKIPDEFNRRYAQMYSTNMLLATYAKGIAILLYVFVFGLFGLYFLYRKRYVVIKQHRKVVVILVTLSGLASLNGLALMWNNYVTTLSKSLFVLQTAGSMILGVIAITCFVGVICFVAEALDRYVFGNHVQFFTLWSRDAACSYTILQQTVLGYCLAAVGLGYVVGFSIIAASWGWWSPLSSLADPNILAMYVPSLTPVITAFFAGFWEELAFRVLPIAGILLLTRNSKQQRYWLVGMIIVQVIIFAGAHASYPQQPAYYRVVELSLFFWLYGLCYYLFGLLPCIIAHFTYDAVLMLIPIWVSTLWLQKILGIFCIGIPLWVVMLRFVQAGHFRELSKSVYNSAWQPEMREQQSKEYKRLNGGSIVHWAKPYGYVIGLVALLAWGFSHEFDFDTPAVTTSKAQAECIALRAIRDQFGDIGQDWTIVQQFVDAHCNNGNKFIWQQYGQEVYQSLQGSYVTPPHYVVKLVKFTGPVELRAEAYEAWVGADGSVLRVTHQLPESAQGQDIAESKAHVIAYDFIHKRYGLDKHDVEFVACDTTKHEHRRDWKVIMRDIKNYTLDRGQARIAVWIAGDEVVSFVREIYPSEEWTRQEAERMSQVSMIKFACFIGMIGVYGAAVFCSYGSLGFASFPAKIFMKVAAFFVGLKFVGLVNRSGQTLFHLNTMAPFYNQMSTILMSETLSTVASIFLLLILLVGAFVTLRRGLAKEFITSVGLSVVIGCLITGVFALLSNFGHTYFAQIPLYDFLNFDYPALGIILNHFVVELVYGAIFIISVWIISRFCFERFGSELVSLLVFIISGICLIGSVCGVDDRWSWLLAGVAWGLIWYLIYRFILVKNGEMLIVILLTVQCLNLIPSVWYGAYPTILIDACVSSLVMVWLSIWVCKRLQTEG